jgi:hypothetical protein
MAEAIVRIDESGYIEAFKSWDGMTGRFLAAKGNLLCEYSQGYAPIGEPGQGHVPGTLVAAITTYQTFEDTELSIRIGTEPEIDVGNIGYAYFVHEGTTPHPILPVRAKMLRFVIDGRVIYAHKVNHPGNAANPYLARFLPEVFT